ncbi:MAG: hypothetical protein AAGA27_08440 [Pseudomonadota bacterium]
MKKIFLLSTLLNVFTFFTLGNVIYAHGYEFGDVAKTPNPIHSVHQDEHRTVYNAKQLETALAIPSVHYIIVDGQIFLHKTLAVGDKRVVISGTRHAQITALPSLDNQGSVTIFNLAGNQPVEINHLILNTEDGDRYSKLITNTRRISFNIDLENNTIDGLVNFQVHSSGSSNLKVINNNFSFADRPHRQKNMLVNALSANVSSKQAVLNADVENNSFSAPAPQKNPLSAMTLLDQYGSLDITNIIDNRVNIDDAGSSFSLYLGGGRFGTIHVIGGIENNQFGQSSVLLAADAKTTMLINKFVGNNSDGAQVMFSEHGMPKKSSSGEYTIYGSAMTILTFNGNDFSRYSFDQQNPADMILIGINNGKTKEAGLAALSKYNDGGVSNFNNIFGLVTIAANLGQAASQS